MSVATVTASVPSGLPGDAGDALGQRLVKRYNVLKGDRSRFEAEWEEIATYCAPWRRGFTRDLSPGDVLTTDLFDATAPDALATLRAFLHGGFTPSGQLYLRMRPRDRALREDDEAREWCEAVTEQMHEERTRSNFSGQINPVWGDLPTFGWAAFLIEERRGPDPIWNGLRCLALPPQHTVIAENGDGEVDTVFRRFPLSARAAVETWPRGTFSTAVQAARQANPDRVFWFLHAIYPRYPYVAASASGVVPAHRKPVASCYVEWDQKTLVHESGYDEFPVMVPRWDQLPGEPYGRGPAGIALPDVRSLNKIKELEFQALAMDIYPPQWADSDGVVGVVRLQPGAINTKRPGSTVEPYYTGARYDVTNLKEEELRRSIRRILLAERLELPPIAGPDDVRRRGNMTATEATFRREDVLKLIGATGDKIDYELITRGWWRQFWLMYRAGVFPPIPESLQGAELELDAENAIARAQAADEALALDLFEERLTRRYEVTEDPSVFDVLDRDAADRTWARVRGVPAGPVRGESDVAAIRQQRAEAQQAEQAMQEAERAAGLAKTLAPAAAVAAQAPGPRRPRALTAGAAA